LYYTADVFTDQFLTAKIRAGHFENPSDLALALSLVIGTKARDPKSGSVVTHIPSNADIGTIAKELVPAYDIVFFKRSPRDQTVGVIWTPSPK